MTVVSRRTALVLTGAGLLLPARGVLAHHGWGSYDAENPLELTGTIETISYEFPHAQMLLASADKSWDVVLGPPTRTRSRGLTDDIAVPGTECTVMGYPHRSNDAEIRVEWVQVNGERYQMR